MKSFVDIPIVVARKPPTSTCAPRPNKMPLGFVRNTWPLEDSRPKICEGLPPSTRLSATAFAEGWLNTTEAFAPMLNDCEARASATLAAIKRQRIVTARLTTPLLLAPKTVRGDPYPRWPDLKCP